MPSIAQQIALLSQAQAGSAPGAATIFYLTLLFIFVTAIVTTVLTKWTRDKCLKFFRGYRVTLERLSGQTIWGQLKVFSSGLEVVYDHPVVDSRGRNKTSFLVYAPEVDTQVLSLLRYHDGLDERSRADRLRQIRRTFNPGPLHRVWRGVRNFVNTLRDAFNAAIGAAVGQYQRLNPANAILSTQASSVTAIGQTLLGRFANAYEPLLEQYIGQPVILDVADPLNPNNATVQYAGYLADYTQQFIAVFNVEHTTAQEVRLVLPDQEQGADLPPASAPPAPGAPPIALSAPIKSEQGLEVRLDGARMKIRNANSEPVVVSRLERPGFEPLPVGMIIPPNGTLDLPAHDARGGTLVVAIVRCLDVVAPRKFATVRHAGELVERRGLIDEIHLDQLPLVPKILGKSEAPNPSVPPHPTQSGYNPSAASRSG